MRYDGGETCKRCNFTGNYEEKYKLRSLSPRANYTDRAIAACRRRWYQLSWIEGCRVVSVADPYGRNLGFIDQSRYYFFQVAPQLYSRRWVDPVRDPLYLRKSGSVGNRTRTSGSVARNSKHWTTGAVIKKIIWKIIRAGNVELQNTSKILLVNPERKKKIQWPRSVW
jgi:hypothetical protein